MSVATKISDLLGEEKPSVSFEVFPPKKDMPLEPVKSAVRALANLSPSFISVTYGAAGGDSSANTSAIAAFVQSCGVTALAHLTCVMATRAGIALEAKKLKTLGIGGILALRGDIPPGADHPSPEHFSHAVELVRYLKANFPQFTLGGACYPEGHPECEHLKDDIAFLKAKTDAGLDFLTSQMFFDNTVFYSYLAKIRSAGITVPVLPGIMPVTNGRQIKRICALSGAVLPQRFKAIVDRFGDDPAAMLDAGAAYATEQIVDLFANGVNHVHLYTMNKPETAARIMRNLGSIVTTGGLSGAAGL